MRRLWLLPALLSLSIAAPAIAAESNFWALKETANYLDVASAIGPAFTGFVGFAGLMWSVHFAAKKQRAQRKWERDQEARSVSAAFAGALKALAKREERIAANQEAIAREVREHSQMSPIDHDPHSRVFVVYEENASSLGLLPPDISERVASCFLKLMDHAEERHAILGYDLRGSELRPKTDAERQTDANSLDDMAKESREIASEARELARDLLR